MIYLSSSCLIFLRPPTSSRVVVGISVKPSFFMIGLTNFRDSFKCKNFNFLSSWLSLSCNIWSAAYFSKPTKSAAMYPEVILESSIISSSEIYFSLSFKIFSKIYFLHSSLFVVIVIVFSNLPSFFMATSIFSGLELVPKK